MKENSENGTAGDVSAAGDLPLTWHYTTGQCLRSIIADGELRPSASLVPGMQSIVWFSDDPYWEAAANKRIMEPNGDVRDLSMTETAERGGGLARIGVYYDTAPHDWANIAQTGGLGLENITILYNLSTALGSSPSQWRGSYRPVSRDQWRSIDVLESGAWVRMPTFG